MIKSRASKLIKKLEEEGKVVTLSGEATDEIDYKLGEEMKKINKEYMNKSPPGYFSIYRLANSL